MMKEILLVEDDSLYSKLLSYILENSGFIVECATNGHQAMLMADTKRYDLVITDILMPQNDGFDVLTHIKASVNCHHTKVMVLSVLSNDYYWSESLSRGADEYIKKPVKAKDFVQAVRRLLYTPAA